MAEEFEFAFGVVDEPIDVRDYHIAGVSAKEAETFPETYEIETSPVKNQGRVGSCVAHALSTAVEHFHKEQEGEDVKFSTGFIYGNRIISNEKLYHVSGQWTGSGMRVRDAMSNLRRFGDVPHEKFPINVEVPEAITYFKDKAFELEPEALPNRISSYFETTTEAETKKAMLAGCAVIMVADWTGKEQVDENGVLYQPKPDLPLNGHCTYIYGWNKDGWLVQNSWGTAWGKDGKCVFPYSWVSHRYALTDEISESKKQKELDDLKQEVQDLKAELKEQKEVYNTLIDRYDELADAKLRAEKLLEKQGVELDSLHGLVDKLTQLETDCAIKDQLIQQKDDELDAAKASGELTKAELTKLTKELHALSEELDKQLDEKEELEAQLEELLRNSNEELQDVNTKYLEIVKDYNKVLVELDTWKAENNKLLEREIEYKKQIEELQNKLIEIEKPYKNWPDWLVKFINMIVNLFHKK